MKATTARLAGEFAAALYSPDQVRAPKGDPEGGRWVAEGAGGQMALDFEHQGREEMERPKAGIPYQPDPERVAEATRMTREAIDRVALEQGLTPEFVEREALHQIRQWCDGCPVTIHLSQNGAAGVLESGRYKTGYETKPEHFEENDRRMLELRSMGVPKNWAPELRPVYAVVQVGEADGAIWGDIQLRLKDSVKQRSTITLGDSMAGFGTGAQVATLLTMPGVAALGNDTEMIAGAVAGEIRAGKFASEGYNYLEVQVHGGVTLDDVEEIVIPAHRDGRPFFPTLAQKAKRKGLYVRLEPAEQGA